MNELTQLKDELRATKLQLYDRDQQLLKLHREIHKMKSVLEQTSMAIKNSAKSSIGSVVTAVGPAAGPTKKCGVSGECLSASASVAAVQKVSKDNRSKQLIKEALLDNSFLRHFLDTHQLKLIVDAMYEKEFSRNCLICKQGTYGSHLYVIAYGHCEIIDNKNTLVNQLGPGKAKCAWCCGLWRIGIAIQLYAYGDCESPNFTHSSSRALCSASSFFFFSSLSAFFWLFFICSDTIGIVLVTIISKCSCAVRVVKSDGWLKFPKKIWLILTTSGHCSRTVNSVKVNASVGSGTR
ncbi:unnamed protein product [Medioppia subpectinata]|uniref:Cyclic nucleotide-binding domain-containing protein n=1 Tax=Medioppia subpectinata TaxID=1979941 RepID=A0A7R9KY12_9ACAR|nr:unnamed protein product [Medioppia subpectinata]CAG2111613.1 unnamed protein product [Medioppia subpectinata]